MSKEISPTFWFGLKISKDYSTYIYKARSFPPCWYWQPVHFWQAKGIYSAGFATRIWIKLSIAVQVCDTTEARRTHCLFLASGECPWNAFFQRRETNSIFLQSASRLLGLWLAFCLRAHIAGSCPAFCPCDLHVDVIVKKSLPPNN